MLLRLLPLLILFASCERPADLPRPISDSIAIGLVAHYTLDGSPKDQTGNNPDLVVGNATVKASERPNKSSENAMYFTGRSNSYAGMDLSSSVLAVNGAISFSFWAKETGNGTFSPRVFEMFQGDYGPGFYWFNWYQNEIKFAGNGFEVPGLVKYNRNQWYHFAMTHDVNAIQLFVNGNRVYKMNILGATSPAAIRLAKYGEIGRLAQRPADAFEGAVRDFRIYNRVVSQNEVDFLYKN